MTSTAVPDSLSPLVNPQAIARDCAANERLLVDHVIINLYHKNHNNVDIQMYMLVYMCQVIDIRPPGLETLFITRSLLTYSHWNDFYSDVIESC